MKKQLVAEISVLNRMMYLLEERSVRHVAEHDRTFDEFVKQLYEAIDIKADNLRQVANWPSSN